jgi:hypothetical protein
MDPLCLIQAMNYFYSLYRVHLRANLHAFVSSRVLATFGSLLVVCSSTRQTSCVKLIKATDLDNRRW